MGKSICTLILRRPNCAAPLVDNVRSSAQFRRGGRMQHMYILAAFISRWYAQWHLVGVMNWDLISFKLCYHPEKKRPMFKVFLCPDTGKAFRWWKGEFLSGWAWVRKKWRLYPVTQFVHQKVRSVGCPSSARKKCVLGVEMGYMGYTKTRKS